MTELINAYRARAQWCAPRAAPLASHRSLVTLQVRPGHLLDQALARAGFAVAHAEVIYLSGELDAHSAMATLDRSYCKSLMQRRFSHMGVSRNADTWQIVLAQPAPPSKVLDLRGPQDAGMTILAAVNVARTQARTCGEQALGPAPALVWNARLADAAQEHSGAMATLRYFNHRGKDGLEVADRVSQAGYRYRLVGENIAVGQESPEEVVAGWLESPGHCANIMRPAFTEMGAGYAINNTGEAPRVYWTQVFGAPR